MRRNQRRAWMLSSMVTLGCAVPCADDGLGQKSCPANSEGSGESSADGASKGATASLTISASLSGAEGDSHEGSGDSSVDATQGTVGATSVDPTSSDETASDSATESGSATSGKPDQTDTGDTTIWCVDADADGYGDPTMCSDEPDPGDVPNDDDCDDADPAAHPGAGANENDPDLCTADEDGDGFGDADPGPGVTPGTDCWDANPALNPSSTNLSTIDATLLDNVLASVDPADASLDLIAPFDTLLVSWQVTTTALRADGTIYINDTASDRLYRVSHELLCLGELSLIDVEVLDETHGADGICGMAFLGDGHLYAIDGETDAVLELDPETGAAISTTPLEWGRLPLDIGGCGAAWDCAQDRLLVANAADGDVYEIDVDSGHATRLAETPLTGSSGALEFDVTTGAAWFGTEEHLYTVMLDGSDASAEVGAFDYGLLSGSILVDDLGAVPVCDP